MRGHVGSYQLRWIISNVLSKVNCVRHHVVRPRAYLRISFPRASDCKGDDEPEPESNLDLAIYHLPRQSLNRRNASHTT